MTLMHKNLTPRQLSFDGFLLFGNFAPSGSAPPDPEAVWLLTAALSVCPWQQSLGSYWCVPQLGYPDALAEHKTNHVRRLANCKVAK